MCIRESLEEVEFELGLEERVGFENVWPKGTLPVVRAGTCLEMGAYGCVWGIGKRSRESQGGINGRTSTLSPVSCVLWHWSH